MPAYFQSLVFRKEWSTTTQMASSTMRNTASTPTTAPPSSTVTIHVVRIGVKDGVWGKSRDQAFGSPHITRRMEKGVSIAIVAIAARVGSAVGRVSATVESGRIRMRRAHPRRCAEVGCTDLGKLGLRDWTERNPPETTTRSRRTPGEACHPSRPRSRRGHRLR